MSPYMRPDSRATYVYRPALGWAIAVLLVGCGSGSSGGGTAPAASALAITSQNAPQAGGAAYKAVDNATGSSNTASNGVLAVVTGNGNTPGLADFTMAQIARVSRDYTSGGAYAMGAQISQPLTCDAPPGGGTAGTLTINANDADNSGTLSTGDTASLVFDKCYSATDKQTVNGTFSLTNLTITGDPQGTNTAYSVDVTVSFSSLSIQSTTGTSTIAGGLQMKNKTTDGVHVTIGMTGTSLSDSETSGPNVALTNFDITSIQDKNARTYSTTGTGRVTDSNLSGYLDFTVSTANPLQGGLSDPYPTAGSITVTGASNTTVTLTATSGSDVELAVDSNGDGQPDDTLTKTWGDLNP